MSTNNFIELTSPNSTVIRWMINVDHIIQVRRVTPEGECMISLVSGQITPAESYTEVLALLRIGPIA